MTHTEKLLKSIEPLKDKFHKYYDEIFSAYSEYSKFDSESLDDYVKNIFATDGRSFFTICSKESFNNLETEENWNNSIVYTPLNDHSRPYMKKGDIVFCYRQGQFSELKEALLMRGIYAIGFVASEPKKLFPKETGHNQYGVAILFPYGMKNHLELRNIQLNPITISLTPYNGNRNDALQYIPEKEYSKTLLEEICRKNQYLRKSIENVIGINIEDTPLPDEIWKLNPTFSDNSYIKNSSQIIYYGVPGCGKSNKIDEETRNISDEQKMRVVFHPEYTNADFVGQILPVQTAEGIEYRFKTGPFARILKRALKNPSKPYCLIIEEINRGNAAAIFGDLFQLLDRKNDGWSSYFVENLDFNSFIRSKNDKYSDKDAEPSVTIGEIDFTENTPIRLPPNLSLYATMNTSDQNVFVLDNAFQRRWDMKLVKNEFGNNSENQKQALIKGSKITWEDFQKTMNNKISELSKENNFSSMIDKRLGCWFVKAAPDKNDKSGKYIITEDSFKNKILKYLWDDAFKFNREEVFEAADNFEVLLKKVKMDNPNFGIFKNIDFSLNNEKSAESEN